MMTRTSMMLFHLIAVTLTTTFIATSTGTSAVYAQDAGMMKPTDKGTLDIRLVPTWGDGSQATFAVSFLNPGTETLHEHQDYDFRILKDGQQVFSTADQTGQAVLHNVEGTLSVPYAFQENGDYEVQVYLAGIGLPAIPSDEEATFPITVVPEFPGGGLLPAFLVASLTTTAIVLSQRFRLI
jgi:hypothetical protein